MVASMLYLNETMQAVVMIVCEKHGPELLDKMNQCPQGNWFMMPSLENCRIGYWPHVADSHGAKGYALFGFAERSTLNNCLELFAPRNEDGSLCPDCAAYEWNIAPSHAAGSVRDPVCGKIIASKDAMSSPYQGELFFFCSVNCRDKFHDHPEKYVALPTTATTPKAEPAPNGSGS
jgi:YHS domain-containing protein